MVQVPNFLASGNINRMRFVKISGAHTVAQAGVADQGAAIGVSQRGVENTPLPGASTLAASSGKPVQIYGLGEMCQLESGGVVAAGAFVKPDADGKGVAIEGGEGYNAQALTPSLASGEIMDVFVCRGTIPEPIVAVVAVGSAQGDAALLTKNALNSVSAADGTKGVILPGAVAGAKCRVYNSVATDGLKIYPATGDDINGGAANAAITIEGKTLADLVCIDAQTWAADFTVNS